MSLYEGVIYVQVKKLPNYEDEKSVEEYDSEEERHYQHYCWEHGITYTAIFSSNETDDTFLDEAVEYCCKSKEKPYPVDVLVVWEVPRLEYGTPGYVALKKKLGKYGIGLVSVPKNHKWKDPFEVMQAEFVPRPLLKLNK